ncbi:ribose-phosphate pyrophosphokinase [Gramella sp. MT6]|uniref:ribose-phosphate pyrophosphokinase n=1 Tax=Gramella sp. MT6 TaxID=2705471 RepID=UPI001C5CE257|nr:ribose-phosphate pyrophosphokinase [Gramella sp. MT6]QYA26969.1 ribose-phosphate pyrophosphokinase [Gramella sp. MT6]
MSSNILFSFLGNEDITEKLAIKLNASVGQVLFRKFPDGESYVRILSDIKDKNVVLICTLHQPNDKFISLYFFSKTAKSLGVKTVCLVAPYLSYMRQDKIFHPGEGVTSKYFGELVSEFFDGIVTIDPHLHRVRSLSSVYSIPNMVLHAAQEISKWIELNVSDPVLIGPDEESKNWVSLVAKNANAPFIILNKTRYGDRKVKIELPDLEMYNDKTPVLVDDIISTARTMIEVVENLKDTKMKAAIVIGIHAIFAGNAYQKLIDSGVGSIVTCNTIPHPTNEINISDELGKGIQQLLQKLN